MKNNIILLVLFLGISTLWGVGPEIKMAFCIKQQRASEDRVVVDANHKFFGVFDGHGGSWVVNYIKENFLTTFLNDLEEGLRRAPIEEIMKESVRKFDYQIFKMTKNMPEEGSGSTACIVYIKDSKLYCINLGDSRAVLYSKNQIIPLSRDHKPSDYSEKERIKNAGGTVEEVGGVARVNGYLALSRALGNFPRKGIKALYNLKDTRVLDNYDRFSVVNHPISNVPDVTEHELDDNDQFCIIGSDGLWDAMNNGEIRNFVKCRLDENSSLSFIVESLVTHAALRSPDDVSAILLCFKPSESESLEDLASSFVWLNIFKEAE